MAQTVIPFIHPITDTFGMPIHSRTDTEPEPGSVVLVNGEFGMAWQRRFVDGLWHPVGSSGRPRTWGHMVTYRNLVLVYDARVRPAHMEGEGS